MVLVEPGERKGLSVTPDEEAFNSISVFTSPEVHANIARPYGIVKRRVGKSEFPIALPLRGHPSSRTQSHSEGGANERSPAPHSGWHHMGWRLASDARIVSGIVGKQPFPDSTFANVDERPIP